MMIIIIDASDDGHHVRSQGAGADVKVSKEQAAQHRANIVEAAGRLFRERGLDGVGVAEITRAAGLTHGGFYGHFASKEALAEEACAHSFEVVGQRLAERLATQDGLDAFLGTYLSSRHRDDAGDGCPMAALASEIPRRDEPLQQKFAAGIVAYVDALADALRAQGLTPPEARARAILLLAALVGGLALARATARAEPKLSDELLATVRRELAATALPDLQPR
jgi:TetR/AcrR family transcriptional repressor of nem operon